MIAKELGSAWGMLGLALVSAVAILSAAILYIRIVGLRSLSKMSSYDFVITIAVGSMIASVILSGTSLAEGTVALGALYGLQTLIAAMRNRSGFNRLVDNRPMLLMAHGQVLEDNLRRARVLERDLMAKLRAANVLDPSSIQAVVLETTGDVSVLHGDQQIHPKLLEDVTAADVYLENNVADEGDELEPASG